MWVIRTTPTLAYWSTKIPDYHSNRSLLVLTTAAFALSNFDRHILNITLNQIGLEFQLSDLQLGSLSGIAFALVYALLGFPVARISAPGRRKTILVTALGFWSLMTAMMGLAANYIQIFLARVGVGVGEAGCVPPSHSMISDSYPPERRASALALFSAGTNIGVFLSFIIGGFVTANYGWRVAFFVAGIPGLFLALLMAFRLKEPPVDQHQSTGDTIKFKTIARELWSDYSIRHAIYGAGLSSIVGYGAVTWLATFLVRTHELTLGQIGLYLAVIIGILGAIGTWLGGYIADRLGRNNPDWRLKFVAVSIFIAKPLSIMFYLIDHTTLALIIFILPAAIGAMFTGPTFAFIYSSIDARKRPFATAMMMFIFNLIGLGIGPSAVGLISDLLSSTAGDQSLRYALSIIQVAGLWAAVHYWLAGNAVNRIAQKS